MMSNTKMARTLGITRNFLSVWHMSCTGRSSSAPLSLGNHRSIQSLCWQRARDDRKRKSCQALAPPRIRRYHTPEPPIRKLFRENPISMSVLCASFAALAAFGVYLVHYYNSHIIGDFIKYPEPVAVQLRRAVFYTTQRINPKKALKYYQQALYVAEDMNMDPFSDEILGVKIQVAALYEKIGLMEKAIEVLEVVRSDCLKWIELFGQKPENAGKRTKLLGKAVQMSTKLGELYSCQHILDYSAAEQKMVWAVTTMLKEQKRRADEGLKEDEGEWIDSEQTGATLEALANHYESKDSHYLAAPLYLQAMSLSPAKSCHTVVIMNNLAVSLALQNPPPTPNQPNPSAANQISSGRVWAHKALELAANIAPPDRNNECDEGCAVATINLGDFALMESDVTEATRRFEEGRALSKAIGYKDGVRRAEKSLNKLAVRKGA